MIHETIRLNDFYPSLVGEATLTSYCLSNNNETGLDIKRQSVLIMPGGGYVFVSSREGEPIALRFASYNLNAFVLDYPVGNLQGGAPLNHAIAALLYLSKNAERYNIDLDNVFVLGFSAGGHLAGITALYYRDPAYLKMLGVEKMPLTLKGVLFGYPVITMGEKTHKDTMENITHLQPDLREKFSIEKQITPSYPPVFVWSTRPDSIVPIDNTEFLAKACQKNGVPCEKHIFPKGEHGEALADDVSYPSARDDAYRKEIAENAHWSQYAIAFIKSLK